MAGFGAGNPGSNPTSGPAFLFGTKPNTPSTSFNLGGNTNTTSSLFGGTGAQPSFGASPGAFGSSIPQPNAGLFGSSATGTTFGAPTVSTPSSGLFGSSTFGAQASAAPASLGFGTQPFGGASTSGGSLTYGQPAVSSSLPGLSFGAPATQNAGVSFGTPAQTNLGFGAPTASVAPLSFGSSTTTSGFGGMSTSLGFGAPNVTAPSGSLPFGSLTSTSFPTSTSLGFQGFSTPASTANKPLGLSFGSTPAPSAGLSFNVPSTQVLGFGVPSTGLFGSLPSKPLSMGVGTNTAQPLNFGSLTTSAAAATPSLGLGGIDTLQNKTGQAGLGAGRSDNVKENQIPNEIIQTIDNFKSFVKEQKSCSSDIARGSTKCLEKVREDSESLKQMLSKLRTTLQKYRAQTDHLKCATATAMRHAEMAQRTHDTPPGLQYDNTAPLQYFVDLVASFEHEMQVFQQEIEHTEKHIKSLIEPKPLTPQELTTAMRRLHDSFVALAGRLQTTHNSVELQKDQYMNLRKYFLKDASDVFNTTSKKSAVAQMGGHFPMTDGMSLGPTPFLASNAQHGYGLHTSSASDSTQIYPSGNPPGWGGSSIPTNALNTSLLGSANLSDPQAFVLQKPPPGTKRGKR